MTEARHQPPEFELEKAEAYGQYILTNRLEILSILRALQTHQSLATLYFNEGRNFLLSTLLAVDEAGDSLTLDFGSEEAADQAALRAKRIVFAARLNKIKIQFVLPGLQSVEFEGRPAFRAAIPDRLLRLQRREYFRLETPVSPILYCQGPVIGGDGIARPEAFQILDLSGGGVSLMVPEPTADHLPVGTLVNRCRIALPEEGVVVATLCVRSTVGVAPSQGHPFVRAGCEFVDMPAPSVTLIQRFITRVERERKVRLAGLG